MSKYSGSDLSVLLVDGYNLAGTLTESVSMGKESVTQQTNPFGVGNESHTPVNLVKGFLTVGGGFFDPVTDALHNAYTVVTGISRTVCAAIEGNVIGKHFIGFEGAYDTKYEVQDQRDGLTKANLSCLVSGAVDEGVIVQHLATYTATWDTKTGGAVAPDAPVDYTTDTQQTPIEIVSNSQAAVTIVTTLTPHRLTSADVILISGVVGSSPDINGQQVATVTGPTTFTVPVNTSAGTGGTGGSFVKCSTNAGGVGHLQVTAYSGSTAFVNKIMHSADESTYAALITFADLGTTYTPAKERKTVAGVVDRYLSNQGNLTGAGSVTAFCGFCRN